MGLPTEGVSPDWTRVAADQMVVSVGPYIFQRELHLGRRAWAKSLPQASPPQRIFKLGFPVQPDSSNMRQVAGVACMMVAWLCCNKLPKRSEEHTSELQSQFHLVC